MTFINDQAMVADGNAWGRVLSRIWRRHGPDARLTFYDQALESDNADAELMHMLTHQRATCARCNVFGFRIEWLYANGLLVRIRDVRQFV